MALALICLLPLSVIDWHTKKIPNIIVLPALLIALLWHHHLLPTLAMFGLAATCYNRGMICGGDVKLLAFLAACLGWWAFVAYGLTTIFIRGWRAFGSRGLLPMTPFVFVATMCTCGILQAWRL